MNQRQLRSLVSLIVVVVVAVFGCYQNQKKGGTIGGGGSGCQAQFRAGQPQTTVEGTRELCRTAYSSIYDPGRKVPLVVGEHLTVDGLKGTVARTDNFQPDPELSSGQRAELSDYQASSTLR